MKSKYILLALLFATHFTGFAQPIEIPETIYFAGMQLNLSKSLRDDLQKQVMEMTRNKTYFQAVVNRTDTYFPIIERVFEEEGLPKDFKYQVIQESKLQSDAVSGSNAVGFWQFKKESAIEVGVLVNENIDERKHIVESTRGAARYLKKNYLMLTNWVYALIAYQTGLGGVKPIVNAKYVGATEMNLDRDMYWYAVKFLAHKLAYEDKVGYNKQPELSLLEYNKETRGKSLSEIATITQINEEKLRDYNKWLSKGTVPDDKNYTILLPVTYLEREQVAARLGIELNKKPVAAPEMKEPVAVAKVPTKTDERNYEGVPLFVTYNNLDAIQARLGDTPVKLAFAGKISPEKFFRFNDMQTFEDVVAGKIYYLESKNNKGITLYHTVTKTETLWDIAQKYGIKIKQLMKKNRMEEGEALTEGRLIYLKYKRPEDEPIVIAAKPITQITTMTSPMIQPKAIAPAVTLAVVPKAEIKSVVDTTKVIQPLAKDTIKRMDTKNIIVIKDTNSLQLKSPKFYTRKDTIRDSSYTFHLIAMQQTLYSLSRYYSVKADTLKAWNKIGTEGIKFDQRIIVNKTRKSLRNKYQLYVVKINQDVNTIASEIGVSIENLLLWNDKKDNVVFQGEMLKIKSEIKK